MTAILVLLTCAVFLTIDYFRSRKRARATAAAPEPVKEALPRLRPAFVGGFEVPENLRYHPGHTWALAESPTLVRVGLDEFAARLLGAFEHINLPKRGQWIRQGQKIVTVQRDGCTAELVSPIEGEVANVNEAVLADQGLAARDPYGEGWLLSVQAPDAKTSFRNLLGGSVARKWMEDAASRLRMRMPALAGAVAQDGGVAMHDVAAHLPDQEWSELAREFFLM
ncbi:MAG TPA: glycine cleavage system protein H [Candidatus Sulfotelmatobacter sp.]|nr:glycine cleavage system protein H [Candidatus Sulfotelmatobacter sp.]